MERAVHINLCIKESIKTYFPVILTDNGSEFLNPKEIEKRSTVPCNRGKYFIAIQVLLIKLGLLFTNREFELQNGFLFTKRDFRVTNGKLGLLFTLS